MENTVLADFKRFLINYRASWNSLDFAKISNHSSRTLNVRWASSETGVSDWGYQEAEEGWKQAYAMYAGRNPKWYFEDVLIEININQEGVAIFWVGFEIDGKMVDDKLLFVETFREENGDWKKIREYVETRFPAKSHINLTT